MGNGALTPPSSNDLCDQFALLVATQEYERIQAHQNVSEQSESGELPLDSGSLQFNPSEDELQARLQDIYDSAKAEYELSIEDCRCPAVVIFKYLALDPDGKKSFHDAIEEYLSCREKAAQKRKAASASSDYSKSFGGTEDDTKNEKEAAEILRGTVSDGASETDSPFMIPPCINSPFDKYSLRKASVWRKYMGAGCYMYVNVLTKEIVSSAPEDYIDDDGANENAKLEEIKDPANGLPSVSLGDLPALVDRIINIDKKTPLIIDPLDVGARAYYSYMAILEVYFFEY
jgi:hypothetical protein